MSWIAAAIAAVGAGVAIYGEIAGANSRADALRADSRNKNRQADELLARQRINEAILRDQSEFSQRDYVASFAATGVEGSGLGGVVRLRKNLEEQISNSRRDAEFKARMLRAGANVDSQLASDAMTAGYLRGTGTALTAAGSGYDSYNNAKPPSTTQNLPGAGNTPTTGKS